MQVLFDLLSPSPGTPDDLTIVEEGGVTGVRGLTQVQVSNEAEALALLFEGAIQILASHSLRVNAQITSLYSVRDFALHDTCLHKQFLQVNSRKCCCGQATPQEGCPFCVGVCVGGRGGGGRCHGLCPQTY